MASISSLGVGSGIDISSLVTELLNSERQPAELRLAIEQNSTLAEISGLGAMKSALSNFQDTAEALDTLSDFQVRSATSSDRNIFTVSADENAAAGQYEIEVIRLAESHKINSGGFASETATVGSGTLNIATGSDSFQVSITSDASSLRGVVDAINEASGNTGVSASIITVDAVGGGSESRLVLTADQTGEAGEITISAADNDGDDTDNAGLSALTYTAGGGAGSHMTQLKAAVDAQIKLDGQTVTSASNTLDSTILGVTMSLVGMSDGEPATLTVSLDTNGAKSAVSQFIKAYNAMIGDFNALSFHDDTGQSNGILLGDATLRGVSRAINRELGDSVAAVNGTFNTLASIGVSTREDGTLTLDAALLNDALEASYEDVGLLFAGEDGIAARLKSILAPYTSTGGTIDSRTDGLNDRLDRVRESAESLARRMDKREATLLSQFIAMDSLVASLNSTGSFLTQQLDLLSGLASRGSGSK